MDTAPETTAADTGPSTPAEYRPDAATLAAVDRWLAFRTWHSQVPGVQVAVGIAGEVLLSRGYGHADLERRTPMTPTTLFRIASHSKTFTATVVLQLVEQGRLGLEDAIGSHLPELADDPVGQACVRELLEHTSGLLRDGLDSDYWQFSRPFPDRAELVELVRAGGAKSAPGERFAYSNLGYSLLGLLIEAVTGQSYADATHERVVAPLALPDTAADYLPDRAGDYAVGYSGLATGLTRRPLEHIATHAMAAATGFTSTAEDLVRYFSAHRLGDTRLLGDRSKWLQQRLANVGDPRQEHGSGYGLGLVVDDIDGKSYVGHSGGYPGHITKTLLDPATGLVISVLTNAFDGPATPLARGVAQLLERARDNAGSGPAPTVSEATLARTGRYASDWGVTDLAVLGGRPVGLDQSGWAPLDGLDELTERPDGWLLIANGSGFGSVGELVTFELDGDRVRSLRYGGTTMLPFDELPSRVG